MSNQVNYIAAVTRDDLKEGIRLNPSAPSVATKGAPVPDGLPIIRVLTLPNYAGAVSEWCTEQKGPEGAIIGKNLLHLDAAVLWEYYLAPVGTVADETHQNRRAGGHGRSH